LLGVGIHAFVAENLPCSSSSRNVAKELRWFKSHKRVINHKNNRGVYSSGAVASAIITTHSNESAIYTRGSPDYLGGDRLKRQWLLPRATARTDVVLFLPVWLENAHRVVQRVIVCVLGRQRSEGRNQVASSSRGNSGRSAWSVSRTPRNSASSSAGTSLARRTGLRGNGITSAVIEGSPRLFCAATCEIATLEPHTSRNRG
jgi:hypothetical protein